MDFSIPAVVAPVLVLAQFLSPYIVSALIAISMPAYAKKIVALVVSFIFSAGLILAAIWAGWITWSNDPIVIIGIVVMGLVLQQTSYRNFVKESADRVTETFGFGAKHTK